jgi:sugar phosphate permease
MLNINNIVCALGFLFANVSVQSISLFLPTILNDMGWKPIQAQLHTVPPYVVACACSVFVAYVSDKMKMRGIFLLIPAVIALIGFVILRTVENNNVKYMAVFFAAMGAFPGGPGYMSWALNSKW